MNCYELSARRLSTIYVVLSVISLGLTIQSRNYTNQWAVHIEGGEQVARDLALKYGFIYIGPIFPDYYHFEHQHVHKRSSEHSSHIHADLARHPKVKWLEQQVVKRRAKRSVRMRKDIKFNDPKWPQMWYLNRGPDHGMKVWNAWAQGYTGKGVVVTILDDGIELNHPDLKNNYDAYASYDVNSNDQNPQPRYDYSDENKHGTRCAGEVAAQANNNICNVGVAFDARIGGVRMLDGDVTDTVEAKSLSLHPQHIHIYSASWGPDDDGRTVDGPATLARKAFYDGITQGRGGLGSIFVWASGNGGRESDNCNCDGYTNSIYTLSISSATESGDIPWYSEACSSTLATTYSSGSGGEKQIVTTDLHNGCTMSHTGTSASAPLAAGVVALALEANPFLTWRDMQHIVVATAKPDGLKAADWRINGLGRRVSHSFGFGLMDADAMVQLARNWTTVGHQHICEVASSDRNRLIPKNGKLTLSLYVDGCMRTRNYVKYLEHVEAKITLTATKRGDIQIHLSSPMGTRSTLLAKRPSDTAQDGFNNWSFMTTHSWGESARGTWLLEIENADTSLSGSFLLEWSLVVYGTDRLPHENKRQRSAVQITPAYISTSTAAAVGIRSTDTTRAYIPHHWMEQRVDTRVEHSNRVDQAAMLVYRGNQWLSNDRYGDQSRFSSHGQCNYETMTLEQYTKSQTTLQREKGGKSHIYFLRKPQRHQHRKWHKFYRRFRSKPGRYTKRHDETHKRAKKTFGRYDNLSKKAELKSWSLIVMGTSALPRTTSYPIARQYISRSSGNHSYICAGTLTTAICLECRPGYFLMGGNCVSRCPAGYYGTLSSTTNRTITLPSNRTVVVAGHAVCKECDDACIKCDIREKPECIVCRRGFTLNKSSGACVATPWASLSTHRTALTALVAVCAVAVAFLLTLLAVSRWRQSPRRKLLLRGATYGDVATETTDTAGNITETLLDNEESGETYDSERDIFV